eukprot:COSAG05_NODE_941_length_6510_cov_42.192482_2_plen_321_part_00
MPSPSKPQAPSRAARDEEEEVRVFNLLRQEIARKKTMEGHTLSDSRAHFAKNTPKSARRSGLLTHSRFIIAVQRLELGLDAHDLNVLTAALDPEGRGVVDPAAFLQEAHNHRHHDRVRQRGPTSYHLASPRSQLAQPTWMSPRGGRYTGGVAGLSGAFTERRAGPQPSVVTVSSRDGLTRFSSKNSTEWVRPADSVALLRSDYLLKGGGRLASPSADLAFAAEATGGLVLDSPKVGFKVVEKPYYVNALDVQVSQRMVRPPPAILCLPFPLDKYVPMCVCVCVATIRCLFLPRCCELSADKPSVVLVFVVRSGHLSRTNG